MSLSRMLSPFRSRLSVACVAQRRAYATPADVAQIFQEKRAWDAFPDDVQKMAVYAEHARAHNYQIPLLSKADPTLDQAKAYHIAAAARALRESANGEVAAGRKLGFTNRKLWRAHGIDAANWSYMYRSTIVDLPEPGALAANQTVTANISHLSALEPRIEPEIVFRLAKPLAPTMSDAELLSCLDWVAHGFEVVASIFPGWRFSAADTTAAFALHGLLLVGQKVPVSARPDLLQELASFTVELCQNGSAVEQGSGSSVLGSPINALRHLAELLAEDAHNPPLEAGEIVTTGTLTAARPIAHGDTWSTKLAGIDLPGLDVRFKLQ